MQIYTYKAKIHRVVDGDTVELKLDLGFNIDITESFRLAGIDTPEIRTRDLEEKKRGLAAKSFLEQLLADQQLYVISHKAKRSFARWVAELYIDRGQGLEPVSKILREHGHEKAD